MNLAEEEKRLNELLKGKTVLRIVRNRPKEILVEFDDATRLFVNHEDDALDLSVTGPVSESA